MRHSVVVRTILTVTVLALIAGAALVAETAPVWANGPSSVGNSCVKCHKILPGETFVGRRYTVWEGSVHAQMDITCNLCHGGDAKASGKENAHKGVYNSGRPQSTTYFKKVPATCGGCHRLEYNRFKRSIHYKELQTTGRGPNCVTCHESKTGEIIQPTQVVETCSVCHNERLEILPHIPVQSYGVLLRMSFAAQMELVTKQLIALAKKSGKSVAEAEQKLQAAREGLDLARVEWHTFSLNRVESSLGDVFKNLREAREISLRPGPSKGTSYQDEGVTPSHRLAVLGGGRR
jgi:hypothetical protein